MSSKELKVLGFWASPFSHRVEWALKLKNIDYEYVEEDIFNKSSQLLELNPVCKKVPVLVHDHEVIIESLLILEYIDETWKDGTLMLMPRNPYERAMDRFWAQLAEEKILRNAWIAMCTKGDQRAEAIELFTHDMERIEEVLKGRKEFFGGENIGYLDLALGWIPYWLPIFEQVGEMEILSPTKFPATVSWMKSFLSHPVIKERLPSREKMVVYFEERRTHFETILAAIKK